MREQYPMLLKLLDIMLLQYFFCCLYFFSVAKQNLYWCSEQGQGRFAVSLLFWWEGFPFPLPADNNFLEVLKICESWQGQKSAEIVFQE